MQGEQPRLLHLLSQRKAMALYWLLSIAHKMNRIPCEKRIAENIHKLFHFYCK